MRSPLSTPSMAKTLAVATLLLLVAAAVPVGADPLAPSVPSAPRANLLVGFHDAAVNASFLAALGVTIVKTSDLLGVASVYAADPANFTLLASANPSVSFVETNGATALDSAGWDSAGWDSAGWDSAGWDSAGWDSAGWDSAGWDSAGWDSAGWDSAGWDSAGWDSAGWDSAGWDSAGWDSAGWDSATLTARAAFTGLGTGPDPLLPYQWGYRAIHGSAAASLYAGTLRTTLCILDTGVDYTHPDLAASVWTNATTGSHGYDFVNGDNDPMDDAGHGTHVAGIAAAVKSNGQGIAGTARETILPVKVLNASGWGDEMDLALGIAYCQDKGAKVISMSLGTTQDSQAVRRAVVRAWNAGILLVASVGNNGTAGGAHYPAAYPQVLGVGAVLPNGARAPYSAVTKDVDIAAPGFAIVSTWPGGGYRSLNGTSQATPYASAIAALLMDANATLTRGQVLQILVHTSHDLGATGKDTSTGYGFVDELRALRAALGMPAS
jgi:subtilisin family serine protease